MREALIVLVAWVVCAPFVALFVADAIRVSNARAAIRPAESDGWSW